MISKNNLECIRDDFSDIDKEYKNIEQEIWGLEENPIVKKYIGLQRKKNELATKKKELYRLMKYGEYEKCDHLWVTATTHFDEGYYICIKCGLNKETLRKVFCQGAESLSFEDKIMYDVLRSYNYKSGYNTHIICDLELASAIYKKIKEQHPDIDDKTVIKYFSIALNDIRNIEVNDERKKSRAKRLGLSKDFNRWN